MRAQNALTTLRNHYPELTQRFKVASMGLFGSAARGEAGPDSDIDILVRFETAPGFDGYMALKWRLEELLGARVDLVMDGALRGVAREAIESELISVA